MRVTTDDVNYYDIADAIRYVLGVGTEYLPSEMAPAIRSFADLIGRIEHALSYLYFDWLTFDVSADGEGSSASSYAAASLDMASPGFTFDVTAIAAASPARVVGKVDLDMDALGFYLDSSADGEIV